MNNQNVKANIDQFNAQELYQLKQGAENEIGSLGQSLNQLKFALDKYEEGKRSIKAIDEVDPNQEMLMPLSSSLYV